MSGIVLMHSAVVGVATVVVKAPAVAAAGDAVVVKTTACFSSPGRNHRHKRRRNRGNFFI